MRRGPRSYAALLAQGVDPTTAYAKATVAGEFTAGPWVRLACERHLRDLDEAGARGFRFDEAAAQHAIDFFEQFLVLAEGQFAGDPFLLQPFQKFIVGCLFGWLNDQGFRRFRTAYVEMGKGQGKSPLAAGIGLYGLVADNEAGAQIYAAAVTREQAAIAWNDARRMAEASPELSSLLEILKNNLGNPQNGSFFRTVSAEHRQLDGKRPHIVIVDELHEHPTDLVVNKMRAGTKARRQPLIFEITNSGYDRKSVCWHHHDYSVQVLKGLVRNDTWFAYVCALDQGDDWLNDESCWAKACPGLGTILPISYLREQVAEAKGMPSKQNIVARLNFCVWTEQSTRWIPLELWDSCNQHPLPEIAEMRGRTCYGGLDLSSTTDITALALYFPAEYDEPAELFCYCWIPEENAFERSKRDHVPYRDWIDNGDVFSTEGNVVDYDAIRLKLNELADLGIDFREIAYDPWNATQLAVQLEGDGFVMVPMRQGFATMSEPTKAFEALLRDKALNHGGQVALRFAASNVAIKQDPAGNIKPDKSKSTERIDPIVASIMATGRAGVHAEEDELYTAERGLTVL